MCEVLIRVVDKHNPDPYLDCKLLKAGDVVTIQENGWQWGSQELANPDWRIIKFTNISVSQASDFLGGEIDVDPANPSRMLRRRAFKFDTTHPSLPASFRTWLADDSRVSPIRSVGVTVAQITAMKKAKSKLQDPNVFEP